MYKLTGTDSVKRFLETGEVVPEAVVLKRTEAREFIRVNTL